MTDRTGCPAVLALHQSGPGSGHGRTVLIEQNGGDAMRAGGRLSLAGLVICLLAAGATAEVIGIQALPDNGLPDKAARNLADISFPGAGGSVGDVLNVPLFAYTDAAVGADRGVATFELLFTYDASVLQPLQYEKSGFGGGLKELLSDVANNVWTDVDRYSWVADMTSDGAGPAFVLTTELTIDEGNHTVLMAGGADAGLKNLGAGSNPILIGQLAFEVLQNPGPSGTNLAVTGSSINPVGGFLSGDQLDLFGEAYSSNGGTADITLLPEPASLLLLAVGIGAVAARRRS